MTKFPVISIIIPIYNTEYYLSECVDSILAQTFSDFEILLIDDGSLDNSLDVCKQLSLKDNRIIVYHQENKGVTAARRLGVYHAKGDYICFVDSDDKILHDALEILINFINNDIDIVITDTKFNGIIAGNDYVNKLLCGKIPVSLWGKLFKKTLFMNSSALDLDRYINIGEDWYANLRMALYTKKVVCVSSSIYLYRDNPSSVMHGYKGSLIYEEKFRDAMERALGEELDNYKNAWYKFQLHLLEKLILQKIKFSYNRPWIQNLFKERKKYSLSVREKITCYVHNAVLCRYLLMLVSCLRHYFRYFYM